MDAKMKLKLDTESLGKSICDLYETKQYSKSYGKISHNYNLLTQTVNETILRLDALELKIQELHQQPGIDVSPGDEEELGFDASEELICIF